MIKNLKSFAIGCAIGIPIAFCHVGSGQNEAQAQEIDFNKYIVETDIEEQVHGVTYTDFTPGYYPPEIPPLHIEATAYCYGKITKSGKKVREGIAAMKEEWIGKTAVVYEDLDGKPGDLIGIYEVEDTGGDHRIQNGTCIDIYIPDYQQAKKFGRQNVIVCLLDAKG